jgi:hypothetical protein
VHSFSPFMITSTTCKEPRPIYECVLPAGGHNEGSLRHRTYQLGHRSAHKFDVRPFHRSCAQLHYFIRNNIPLFVQSSKEGNLDLNYCDSRTRMLTILSALSIS